MNSLAQPTSGSPLPHTGSCPARLNPLAAQHTERLAFRFPSGSWESHWEQLHRLAFRAAIVGPKGSGKTTLLEQLRDRLIATGAKCHLTRPPLARIDQQHFLQVCLDHPEGTLLLVDSAEQLTRWNWWQLTRRSAKRGLGLMVTLHRPRRSLPTWLHCQATPELFLELLDELVPHPAPHWRAIALAAYHQHSGNIREAFRELYDQLAGAGMGSQPVN